MDWPAAISIIVAGIAALLVVFIAYRQR